MHRSTAIGIFGLALAQLSSAQSTISLFIPGADTQPLAASIVGSDATATTYVLQCMPGTESDECGFPQSVTLTEGPSVARYTFEPQLDETGGLAFTGYIDCSLAGTASAVCTASGGGSEANFGGLETETFTGSDYTLMPVVITAGPASGSESTASSATMSGPPDATNSNTSGSSSDGADITPAPAPAPTAGSSSPSSTSTAGMPAMTGNMNAIAGVAAAVVVAMAV